MDPSVPVDRRTRAPRAGLRAAFADAWQLHDGLGAWPGHLAVLCELAAWRPWLGEARTLLDTAELDRVGRKRRPQDHEELVLAYALHRLVLGQVLQFDPALVALRRDALGCPRLPGDGVHTSLSHAAGCVAIAVSRHGPIGIDLEPAARAGDMASIADRVCHPDEAAALAALPGSARAAALLALWVRKEALLKAAGIGLALEMDSFQAPLGELLTLPGEGGAKAVVRMLEADPPWVAALAGAEGVQVRCAWIPRLAG